MSCDKSTSPIFEKGISIEFTGRKENETYEFRISNNSIDPLWYYGFRKRSPLYHTSVLTYSGWVLNGPLWCDVGAYKVKLNSGAWFLMEVNKPVNYDIWRVGIRIYYDIDKEGEIFWGREINSKLIDIIL